MRDRAYYINDPDLGRIEKKLPDNFEEDIGPDPLQFWFYVKFNAPQSVYEACYQRFEGVQSTLKERIDFYLYQVDLFNKKAKEFSAKWHNK